MIKRGKFRKILIWFFVFICAIMAIGTIPSVEMILFAGVAVMLLPIKKIDSLWIKMLKGKRLWIKTVSLIIVFFIAGCMMPQPDKTDTNPTEIASEINSETQVSTETQAVTESDSETETQTETESESQSKPGPQDELLNNNSYVSLDSIPAYDGKAYVAVNDNVPFFTDSELTTEAFEYYSELDSLGRCGVTYANVCKEMMPTEERGKIGMIKPSGWHTIKYDVVDGKYLYNRCHLIGYQLSGENANKKNLITGTRYLNIEGMLPFENMVADYVKETGHHVLYRVTTIFEGDNLVANGVLMEAESVEDNGSGILFNVYCYNVQPGVTINYATGESSLDGTDMQQSSGADSSANSTNNNVSAGTTGNNTTAVSGSGSAASDQTAVSDQTADQGNPSNEAVTVHITKTGKKYHRAGCRYLKDSDSEVTLDEAKSLGLSPCGVCNPPQ